MGYPYAPQLLDRSTAGKTIPIPLKIGQVLVFSQAILHGSTLEHLRQDRWSCDTRCVIPLQPVKRDRTEAFIPLTRSPVTKAAER